MKKIYLAFLSLLMIVGLGAQTFNSGVSMSIGTGAAGPFDVYPNDIVVAGVGTTGPITVTIDSISHTWAGDVELLLVGPTGASSILMADDPLGGTDFVNNTLTFQTGGTLPLAAANGTYDVSGSAFGGGAPAPAGPYTADLSVFDLTNADGTWSLYAYDDANGDGGSIVDWSITFSTPPACPGATGLMAAVTLPSTVDLSWTASGSATDYTVEYRVVGAPTWTAAPGNPIAGTTVQLTGLSTDDFEWRIFANCPGPATSTEETGTFTTIPYPGTCADAISVGPGTISAPAPDSGGGAANNCAGTGATNAVWYAYTATVTGTATVSSDLAGNPSDIDTRLSIHSGTCGTLTCIGDDDDAGVLGDGLMSIETFDICAGTTYYIEWDDRWSTSQQDFDFTITETADCAAPSTATITPTIDGYDATTTWTGGAGETCGGGYEWAVVADGGTPTYSGADLANGSGTYPISVPALTTLSPATDYDFYVRDICGAGFSTEILTDFTTLALCSPPSALGSVVTLPSTVDLSWTPSNVGNSHIVEYRIVGAPTWTAAPGNNYAGSTAQLTGLATADYEWRVASACPGPATSAFSAIETFTTIPFPGTCAEAIPVGPGTTSAASPDNGGGAVNNCFASGGTNAVWYAYTATTTGSATVSSDIAANLGLGLDTRLSVYTGTCGSLVCYAQNDDTFSGNIDFASEATFTVCAGETYLLEWDDRWGVDAQQPFDFTITETASCSPPSALAAGAATLDGILSVSWSAGSGLCGGGYEYEIVLQGDAPFAGNDIQSGSGTYPLTPFDVTGLNSGTTYEIFVRDNCGGGTFSTDISGFWTTLSPPPVNDDCANAIPIACGQTMTANTGSATSDASIGSCGVGSGGTPNLGVWYSFVGTGEDVQVTLCGSDYDTKLHIYESTGGTCATLTCLDSNDDGALCSGLQSSITFSSVLGTTYYFLPNGFSSSSGNMEISVTCIPAGAVTWLGNNSDDDDPTNWSSGVVPDCSTDIFVPLTANNPVFDGLFECNDFGIASSATASLVTLSDVLGVCGDVSLSNSVVVFGDGIMSLNGTNGGVNFSGASNAVVQNLRLTSNYTFTGELLISNSLTLDGGNLDATGADITLFSGLTATAYFDDFSGAGGVYTGDITVQRFISDGFAGGLGQRYIGTAVSGSTVTGLDPTYTVYPTGGYLIPLPSCDPTQINAYSPYSNLMQFDEDASFASGCEQEGWFALDASTTNLVPGRGYSAWVNNGSTIEVTGAPNTGTQGFDVTFTPTNTTVTQGFNVISNPYPSPISVDAVTATGLTSPQYYNASTGAFSGTFQPVIVAGSEIPVMQGFTVFSTTTATLNIDNTARIASNNPNFAQAANWYTYKLDVQVSVDGKSDITYVSFGENTTAGFDNSTDCVKRPSIVTSPTLYTVNNNEHMSLNAYNESDLGQSVPMGLISPATGTATFSFDGMNDFPANTTIYVEDLELGIFHNVADGDYVFEADANASNTDRFVIHFVAPVSFDIVEPTCDNPTATVLANVNDARLFDVIADGSVINSGSLNGSAIVLESGDYSIEVHDAFGGSQVYAVSIDEINPVSAAIIASASAIEVGEEVNFEFNGSSATAYEWTIDGNVVAQTELFHFQFNTPGTHVVELFASNEDCEAIASHVVEVAEKSTSIVEVGEGTVSIYASQGNVVIEFNNINQGNVDAAVYNLLGQELAVRSIESSGKQTIESVNWADGYYLVKVQIGEEVVNETVLLTK